MEGTSVIEASTEPSDQSIKAATSLLRMVSTEGINHRTKEPMLVIANIQGAARVVAAFIDDLLQKETTSD
jgi:arginine repressor